MAKNEITDFLSLVAEETKKKKQEEQARVEKTAPLLADMFGVVTKAKVKVSEQKEEEKRIAQPILEKFESALRNPEQFKKKTTEETRKQVVQVVEALERKASELEKKLEKDSNQTKQAINAIDSSALTALEKKFLNLFKKLQQDFDNLKKYALQPQQSSPYDYGGWGGAGSGEVNLRGLDDVDISTLSDGLYLRYDAIKNKFVFSNPETGGGAGNGTETRTYRTTINTQSNVPFTVVHNLNLPVKESLIINTFLDGEKVDVRVITLTINSLQITTEIAVTGLFVNIVGII